MLKGLKNAASTLKALKILCETALVEAEAEGLAEVGAEHFLLAAFELPDGTARNSFRSFAVDREGLRAAIQRHYAEALAAAGALPGAMPPPLPITKSASPWATLPSSASGRAVLERLSLKGPTGEPLCGADVILAALAARRGVVPRLLAALGIPREALELAARTERDAWHASL